MNFEFIDLSLDDRQFKGETHNKNLEDAMKQAIVNFCKSTDTGLFLLDMPTGFGKTYSVLDFMVDYYDSPEFKDKKIFFVTTLKKNLPDRENFIIKPVDGERGSITFFDFTDYETFSCTKMGVLYDILNALHDEFGKYIRVKFKQYSIDEVLEYKRAPLELYKDIVKKEVLNSGIDRKSVV